MNVSEICDTLDRLYANAEELDQRNNDAETQAELRAIKKAQSQNEKSIIRLEKMLEEYDQNLVKA